jgi:hypothetical protein
MSKWQLFLGVLVPRVCPVNKNPNSPPGDNFFFPNLYKVYNLYILTPKGKGHFSQKMLKSTISSSRSKNEKKYFFGILTIKSSPRLLGEHAQIISKTLTTRIVRL